MNAMLLRSYRKAKEAGRLCKQCGWIITVVNFKKGHTLCAGCHSAKQGVNRGSIFGKWLDEPIDRTGEML